MSMELSQAKNAVEVEGSEDVLNKLCSVVNVINNAISKKTNIESLNLTGYSVVKYNTKGFHLTTPLKYPYHNLWVKTSFDAESEFEKYQKINSDNYPSIGEIFILPLGFDPKHHEFAFYPFVRGIELADYFNQEEIDQSYLTKVLSEIASKFEKLYAMGLEVTDSQISLGANFLVNPQLIEGKQDLVQFIDFDSLRIIENGKKMVEIKVDQAIRELEYSFGSLCNLDENEELDLRLKNKLQRVAYFLNTLLDQDCWDLLFQKDYICQIFNASLYTDEAYKILNKLKPILTSAELDYTAIQIFRKEITEYKKRKESEFYEFKS